MFPGKVVFMRPLLVGCFAATLALGQSVSLTVTTGVVRSTVDEKIYGVNLDPRLASGIWGEVVRNRSFEETLTRGPWRVNNGVLECARGDGRFRFGEAAWHDYEVAVDAVRPEGGGAILIGAANYTVILGGDRYELVRDDAVLQRAAGQIESGRAYQVRLRMERQRLQVWLDGSPLFDAAEGGSGPAFVGTRGGAGNFAHLKVTALAGTVLLPGIPLAAYDWYVAGAIEAPLTGVEPLNGTQSVRLVLREGEGGIEQHGIAVRAGDSLRGSLWMRGRAQGVTVRLVDGARVLASHQLAAPGEQWSEIPLALAPADTSADATLQILVRGPAVIFVDQVSLMPDSARATGGFRADLLQALAALHPPILRWEAGDWKGAIGPQAKRSAPFGIDEAVALARKVGAQLVPVAGNDPRELLEYCRSCGLRYVEVVPGMVRLVPLKDADPPIKIVSGWNTQNDGLRVAAALNVMERSGVVRMAAADGLIGFDPSNWSPAPGYAVLKLYREHYASDVLQMGGDAGGLDAIATRTADGGRIFVKLINPRNDSTPVEVALRGDFPLAGAAMQVMSAEGRLDAAPVERAGLSVRFRVPAQCLAVVTLAR